MRKSPPAFQFNVQSITEVVDALIQQPMTLQMTNMVEAQDEYQQCNVTPPQLDEHSPAADNDRTYDLRKG